MPLLTEDVKQNQNIELLGDVVLKGAVGEKATLTVNDGSITIEGGLGDGAKVILRSGLPKVFTVHVKGDVGINAAILAPNAHIKVEGAICKGARLMTKQGRIDATVIAADTKITTDSGDIYHQSAHPSAKISTASGRVHVVQSERLALAIAPDSISPKVTLLASAAPMPLGNKVANDSLSISSTGGVMHSESANPPISSTDKSPVGLVPAVPEESLVGLVPTTQDKSPVHLVFPTTTTPKWSANLQLMVFGGFIAALGAAAVAIAISVVTFGVGAVALAGLGAGTIAAGIGLFGIGLIDKPVAVSVNSANALENDASPVILFANS